MDDYKGVLKVIKQDLSDNILSLRSIIQVNLTPGQLKWYYSKETMQRDYYETKKEFDEGNLDFMLFERIERANEEYEADLDSLKEMEVEDFIKFLEAKLEEK